MSKKAKLPTDVNARAKAIVDFATSDEGVPDPDEGTDRVLRMVEQRVDALALTS